MMIQARELEALQKRIREAEERLAAQQSYNSTSTSQTEQSEQDGATGKDDSA